MIFLRSGALALVMAAGMLPAQAFEPIVSPGGSHRVIHPGGGTAEILATREQTGGQFSAVMLEGPAGDGPGPAIMHSNETELWYVLEGEYEFHVGDRTLVGGPGTFVAVDAGQSHGFISKTAGKLLVVFAPGGYEHFFIDWDAKKITPGPDLGALEEQYGVTRP